jgi:hypothetical protein
MARDRLRLGALILALVLPAASAGAGVKYGDAVPAIVKKTDLERIRSVLNLDRFSVIAAVWLGATEGREVIITEPIPDPDLARVKESCDAGRFCPDPGGFIASRVRIAVLDDQDVTESLTIDTRARNPKGRLFDLEDGLPEGRLLGWAGRASAWGDHVALAIAPILVRPDGKIVLGIDPPLTLRWNEDAGRFQFFDCWIDESDDPQCAFESERED